jgi:serine/threonine protein kinase
MYIHGGKSNGYHSDMYRFHITKRKWYYVTYKDKAPLARYGHALLQCNGALYIVGGYDQHGFCCDDLYQFSPDTHSWRKIQFISPLGAISIGRFHSGACIYKSKILIYAGKGADSIRSDLLEYDLNNHTWKRVITAKGAPDEPPGRWGHSCNVIGDFLYIFGGRDGIAQFNDLYCFDLVNLKWKLLLPSQKNSSLSGMIPEPRYFHSGVAVGNSLYMVWGKNIYDFNFDEIIEWKIKSSSSSSPDSSTGSATAMTSTSLSDKPNKDDIRLSAKSQGSDSSFNISTLGSIGAPTSSTSRLSGERRMRLKCVFREEMRIISVPPVIGYQELQEKLSGEYGEDDLKIQYEDDEGDLITIRSAADVEEAFVFFGDAHRPSVKLLLSSSSTSPQSLYSSSASLPPSSPQVGKSYMTASIAVPRPTGSKERSSRRDSISSTSTPLGVSPVGSNTTPRASSSSHRIVKWQSGGIIGEGGFGKVYLGMNSDTGELMAVKQVPLGSETNQQVESLRREIALMQDLHHPNIVRYFGSEAKDGFLNIFLEYQPGGSIASLLTKFHQLSERIIRSFTKQTLLGLEYLHSHGIAHRDIKGANLLVDLNGCVKLADFGASKQLADLRSYNEGFKTVTGSPYWMAPEVIQGNAGGRSYGRKADIWSLGAVVIEMATGKPPFHNLAPVTALFRIGSSSATPEMPQALSALGKDFLSLCFRRDVSLRPSASELLEHPWIAQLDESSSPTISATYDTKTLAFEQDTEEAPKVHVIEAPVPGPMPKNPKSQVKKTSTPRSSLEITDAMASVNLDKAPKSGKSKKKSPRRPTTDSPKSSPRTSSEVTTTNITPSASIASFSDDEEDGFGSILDFVSSRANE